MARITTPLTDTQIKQAKVKGSQYSLCDGKSLHLLIRPSGTKSWQFKYYKPISKKRTNMGLGSYPEVSLAQARELAHNARSLLARNVDPQEDRDDLIRIQRTAETNSLKHVTKSWVKVKRSQVSADHAFDIYRSFELHLFPKLGPIPVTKLSADMAIKALNPIQERGHLDLVKRLAQRLNEVMTFAVNTDLIKHNPLAGITKTFKAAPKQNYPTIKPSELPAFMDTLLEANISHLTRSLIKWQLHTMVRPSEAAGAKWSEIDFEKNLWIIPAERMKKKKQHALPLTEAALAILQNLKGKTGDKEHVFYSARTKSGYLNESTANVALKRMGYQGTLVAHGMRSIASTALNEHGFPPDLIESALAHIDSNKVRAAYNRAEYIEQRRPLMEWWSDLINNRSTEGEI
jgi:integrase